MSVTEDVRVSALCFDVMERLLKGTECLLLKI